MKYKLASTYFVVSQLVSTIFLSLAYFVWFPNSLSELSDISKKCMAIIDQFIRNILYMLCFPVDHFTLINANDAEPKKLSMMAYTKMPTY